MIAAALAAAVAAHIGYLAHKTDDPDIYDKAVATAGHALDTRAAAERAAIVAWLRSGACFSLADCIERGEHARPAAGRAGEDGDG